MRSLDRSSAATVCRLTAGCAAGSVRTNGETMSRVLTRLDRRESVPFFLVIHPCDPPASPRPGRTFLSPFNGGADPRTLDHPITREAVNGSRQPPPGERTQEYPATGYGGPSTDCLIDLEADTPFGYPD